MDTCFGNSNDIEQYRNYSENAAYIIFVIKDGDEIAATTTQYAIELFTFGFQPCLMLFNIAVKPEYRKSGMGRLLLEFIIENAKGKYKSISLTCLADAHAAHNLYESLGFKKTDSVKFELHL